jgi:hypothetical protein
MDVDDRSDSDDDEEIVERGAFNALVVVVCAVQKSYTLFFLFVLVFNERENVGDRNKRARFFFFCIQQRTNSKKRNASFDCFRTRSISFSLQPRAARTTLHRRESVDRWWKMDVNLLYFSSSVVVLCVCLFVRFLTFSSFGAAVHARVE